MNIVALSATTGSLGDEIGQEVAHALSCEFVNREIITKATERYGESLLTLLHVTEEKPTLWERITHNERRYAAAVEAIVLDMATRERAVLSGRGSVFILASVPYVLRVRVTAAPAIRAGRIQHQHGLTTEAAVAWVERRDHERAARIRYLYHLDWADPGLYDMVISTDRLSVTSAAKLVRSALEPPSYEATPEAIQAVVDRRIVAEATEIFFRSPVDNLAHIGVVSRNGRVTLRGMVGAEEARRAAESSIASLAGVQEVLNEVTVLDRRPYPAV